MENIVLFDWLSFTMKTSSPDDVIELLGLDHVAWGIKEKGARGYKQGLYYESISIFFDGREDMGCWCEMSGSGCRTYEDVGHYTWSELFRRLEKAVCNVTRLDISFDDHTGILDIVQIDKDLRAGEFVSKAQKVQSEWSFDQGDGFTGRTIYIGSMSSRVLIRMYDKAAQLKRANEHWIRIEIQLRGERAWEYIKHSGGNAGANWAGVLLNYVRFVDPDETDSNRWRWPMKPYWQNLVQDAEAISLYTNPGREYNEAKTKKFVFQHAGNAIAACREMYGDHGFWSRLDERNTKHNPKYDAVVRQYKEDKAEYYRARVELAKKAISNHTKEI